MSNIVVTKANASSTTVLFMHEPGNEPGNEFWWMHLVPEGLGEYEFEEVYVEEDWKEFYLAFENAFENGWTLAVPNSLGEEMTNDELSKAILSLRNLGFEKFLFQDTRENTHDDMTKKYAVVR